MAGSGGFDPAYVALMRNLRMERSPWREGDWVWWRLVDGEEGISCWASDSMQGATMALPAEEVWLPLLGQWLTILEEAGFPYVQIERVFSYVPVERAGSRYVCSAARFGEEPPAEHVRSAGRWPSCEEGLARLWMAITGWNESVRCPACGAAPGQPCRRLPNGGTLSIAHSSRRRLRGGEG